MALCLPFRRWAIWVARRPSVLSLASTTNQSPRTLPDLANSVVFVIGIGVNQSAAHALCGVENRPGSVLKRVWQCKGGGPKVSGRASAKLTSRGSRTLPEVRPGESPPYNECMQSESPLDTLISAADRALRSVFAPARASRPLPEPAAVS